VGDFLNKKYISIKEYIKRDKNSYIKKQYKIKANPTVLLLDSNGNEIDRLVGFGINRTENPEDVKNKYFQKLKDYTENKNTFSYFIDKFNNENNNVTLNYELGKKYIYRDELEKAYPHFQFIVNQASDSTLKYLDEASLYVAKFNFKKFRNPSLMWQFINSTSNEKYINEGFYSLLRFYKQNKMSKEVDSLYVSAIKNLPKAAEWYFRYAWHSYTRNCNYSVKLMLKALSLDKYNEIYWLNLSILNQFKGELKNAIEAIRIAISLNPDNEKYRKFLSKIIDNKFRKN